MDDYFSSGFVLYVFDKTDKFPYEFMEDGDIDKIRELIVEYVHAAEIFLKDKYRACEIEG